MIFLYHTQSLTQRLIYTILHIRYRYFRYPHKKNKYLLYNLYVFKTYNTYKMNIKTNLLEEYVNFVDNTKKQKR